MTDPNILRRLLDLERAYEQTRTKEVITYATGTWTPAFAGSGTPGTFTYSNQLGFYARTGNVAHIAGFLSISAISVAPTGTMSITGLPFAAKSTTGYRAGVEWAVIDNFNYAAGAMQLTGAIVAGLSSIFLFESFDNGGAVQTPAANFTNVNCNLQFSATYLIA